MNLKPRNVLLLIMGCWCFFSESPGAAPLSFAQQRYNAYVQRVEELARLEPTEKRVKIEVLKNALIVRGDELVSGLEKLSPILELEKLVLLKDSSENASRAVELIDEILTLSAQPGLYTQDEFLTAMRSLRGATKVKRALDLVFLNGSWETSNENIRAVQAGLNRLQRRNLNPAQRRAVNEAAAILANHRLNENF